MAVNFPLNEGQIKYLLIELNRSHFFKIDDHPNARGHQEIASLIIKNYLSKDKNLWLETFY